MSLELRRRIFDELQQLILIDPHTHIDPRNPASQSLADILGYHYYTELAHSAGLSREAIEDPDLSPRDKSALILSNLGPIENTAQFSWLLEIARELFGFQHAELNGSNWEDLYNAADAKLSDPDWPRQVMEQSRLEAMFLTNDFDDTLEGFDTNVFIPCLRTDDLVFKLSHSEVQERLEAASDVALRDVTSLRLAIERLFRRFKSKGARACAISLPPSFSPANVTANRADVALENILHHGAAAAETHRKALESYVFRTLAEMCEKYQLPFDLMIGVNRGVYEGGVHQGRDLYDSRVSLIQYKELFNAFPQVTFPVSVLASATNQELASYAWIFPNVVTNGHWWYSNTPSTIESDLAARLEAVPRTKQIGYYSDMYKLEFALPKFGMYKRVLAKVLAERFVEDRGWSEEKAIDLGQQLLRGNVESIFKLHEDPATFEMPAETEYAAPTALPTSESFHGDEGYGQAAAMAPVSPESPLGVPTMAGLAGMGLGLGAAAGALAEPSLGGTDFQSPEPLLRPSSDEFILQPSAEDGSQINLADNEIQPPPAESSFALAESDRYAAAQAAGQNAGDEEPLDLGAMNWGAVEEAETEGEALPELNLNLPSAAADEVAAETTDTADEYAPAEFLPDAYAPTDDSPTELGKSLPAFTESVEEAEAPLLNLDEPISAEEPPQEPVAFDMFSTPEPAAEEEALPVFDAQVEQQEDALPMFTDDEQVAPLDISADATEIQSGDEEPLSLDAISLDEPENPEPKDGFLIDIPDPPKKQDGINFDFLK